MLTMAISTCTQVAGTRLGVFVEGAAALILAHIVGFWYDNNDLSETSDTSYTCTPCQQV